MKYIGIVGSVAKVIRALRIHETAVSLGVGIAVVLGGLVYSYLLGDTLRFPDEEDYLAIARNIVGSSSYSLDGVHPTAYRPPGYPLFLSVLVFLGAGIVHLRMVNFLLLGSCIYLLRTILRATGSKEAAVIGALLVLAYPVLFYTAGTLYPQTLASMLFLLFLSLVIPDDISSWRICIAGFVIGFLILTVPTFIFVLVLTFIYFSFSKRRLNAAFVLLGSTLLVILPWMARNHAVFGTFIPFTTNSGIQLHLANSAGSRAGASVGSIDLSQSPCEVLDLTEVERDSCHRAEAVKYIHNNKLRALGLYSARVLHYFNYRNELTVKTEGAAWKDLVMLLSYGPLLAILVYGLYRFRHSKPNRGTVFLLLLYLLNPLFQAVFLTRIRYRLPFDFLLIALDAAILVHLCSDHDQRLGEDRPVRQGI